jgi:hypothetical protein
VKYQADKIQVHLKSLSVVERMKRSQEKCTAQKQIHTIQSKSYGSNSEAPTIQDKAYQVFTEVEGQGAELEQVSTTAEQCLEGPINDEIIQEFVE